MGVIEFQQRGLPHAHIILRVCDDQAPTDAASIDAHVSAKRPGEDEPLLRALVDRFMTHSNCAARKCFRGNGRKCRRRFPKDTCAVTHEDERGYPVYARGPDDTWIVPYNRILLLLFECHINVEVSFTVKTHHVTPAVHFTLALSSSSHSHQCTGLCKRLRYHLPLQVRI